ncbi:MAG: 50S ribosomal protein L24 [Patescibacteria group bacterium]
MKIKKGDQVQIIAGKDRGKRGLVVRVIPVMDKVVVAGVNMMKRHLKPESGRKGERVEKEAPLHVSNVMLICTETDKPTRVAYQIQNGEKVRISKRSGKVL